MSAIHLSHVIVFATTGPLQVAEPRIMQAHGIRTASEIWHRQGQTCRVAGVTAVGLVLVLGFALSNAAPQRLRAPMQATLFSARLRQVRQPNVEAQCCHDPRDIAPCCHMHVIVCVCAQRAGWALLA